MYAATDNFDPAVMAAFMRTPEMYWATRDAFSPSPETMDFAGHMARPDVWTMAATYQGKLVGFVQFTRRTSICAEMEAAFLEGYRGKVALGFCQFALGIAFDIKCLLKVIAVVPSDNRPALMGVRRLGFAEEGRLQQAIVRGESRFGKAGLYDLVLFGRGRHAAQKGVKQGNGIEEYS
jgi:hypothetical protein